MATVNPNVPQAVPVQRAYVAAQPQPAVHVPDNEPASNNVQLKVISHSHLFYWWPVWVVGYFCALMTYISGAQYQVGDAQEYYHPSSTLGIVFFLTLFLTILITNVTVRGLASGMVMLSLVFTVVLFAYLEWWDPILRWMGNLSVHLNLGAYLVFSTLVFTAWALAFFVFDRLNYWTVRPGQVTREFMLGGGSRSFDTDGMVLEKRRDDVFRHWILGFGSGDLHIIATGARREEFDISNVLFAGAKAEVVQRLIATKPDDLNGKAG